MGHQIKNGCFSSAKHRRTAGVSRYRGQVGGSTCGRRYGKASQKDIIAAQLRGENVRAGEGRPLKNSSQEP